MVERFLQPQLGENQIRHAVQSVRRGGGRERKRRRGRTVNHVLSREYLYSTCTSNILVNVHLFLSQDDVIE